jgi:hypothetical protein
VRTRLLLLCPVLVALALAPRTAPAEEFTRRSLTLPDGSFEITGEPARPKILGINLSRDRAGEPVYVAPHFYWGAADRVTVGITHDRGLCLTGEDGGCGDRPYNDAGFGLLAGLSQGRDHEIDFHLGVPVGSFDPFVMGVKTGVLGRINATSFAFVFDPFIYAGITRRDEGNREALVIPIWFYFQATRSVAPFVGTGVAGPLDDFGGNFAVPVEGGVVFEVAQNVDLGVVLRFDNLLGNHSTADARELGMLARFRF